MLRIPIISRNWFPSIRGGAERFISVLADLLCNKNFEIIGITRYFPGFDKPKARHKLIYYLDKYPLPFVSSIRFSLWAARIVNRLGPDVVIVNGYWAEASPIFIRKNIPVIVVIHDVGLFRSEWARRHRFKHFLRVKILRRVVERADRIVVPVDSVKNDLVEFLGVSEDKIVVLGGEGVEGPMRFDHIDNDTFDIVQVGRFAPNKGQLVTLRAFRKVVRLIPNARLWLVGGKPIDKEHWKYFQRVKELADEINREMGKDNVVRIIVDAPDVSEYYRLADVCVASSVGEEGYGLVVAECMAYGKPVIASDIFRETGVASEDRALIYRRGDHEELANNIIKLYRDRKLYERLSRNALRYAKSVSWDRVADVFEEIIKEISGKER